MGRPSRGRYTDSARCGAARHSRWGRGFPRADDRPLLGTTAAAGSGQHGAGSYVFRRDGPRSPARPEKRKDAHGRNGDRPVTDQIFRTGGVSRPGPIRAGSAGAGRAQCRKETKSLAAGRGKCGSDDRPSGAVRSARPRPAPRWPSRGGPPWKRGWRRSRPGSTTTRYSGRHVGPVAGVEGCAGAYPSTNGSWRSDDRP